MYKSSLLILSSFFVLTSKSQEKIKLITLDPGHFHAALIQKSMYPQVDPSVHVYAEEGNDLKWHLERIEGYNKRSESPTNWQEKVYTGKDFFKKMIAEKQGNVVVLAGNNRLKTSYILEAIQNGYNVFADKPMVINLVGFNQLKKAFAIAKQKNVQLYDIMTERYEITTILQRAFSLQPEVFGQLEKGTPNDPAVTKESVHHFYKYVSGSVLTRPSWFFDVNQEGDGIVDVTTHLVDLIQWECFPEKIINYTKNVHILQANSWNTAITPGEFMAVTKETQIPEYLQSIKDAKGNLQVKSNGAFTYTINGVHAKVSVIWNYRAPEGTGDTHYSLMRGSLASLVIKQGKEEQYKPTLYIYPVKNTATYETSLTNAVAALQANYPGISYKKTTNGFEILVPEKYKEGHESHFARVTEKYLDYLQHKNMPAWEVPNMIAKYYTTSMARELAEKPQK
ncbi:MAG: Gfo/Idh/MocA family oxidoreductase [Chitinophagaceae bacterium]|nr:Gfo/Idh/MocA family oxidoreductase [Chitinophagaceae bacterium]